MQQQTAIQNALTRLELAYQDDSDLKNPVRWHVYPVRRSGNEIFIEYFGLDIHLEPSNAANWNEKGFVNTAYGLFLSTPRKTPDSLFYYAPTQVLKSMADKADAADRSPAIAVACALLEISYPARSLEKVKFAYRIKAKQTHPDGGGNAEQFALVQEAYEILKATLGGAA